MRDYAKLAPQFWIGQTGKAIRKAGQDAQIAALYLMSSPHANMIGMYHLPIAYLSADAGIPYEGACKALQSLREIGFCDYDDDAEIVWVFEMARFQIGEQLKPGDKQCLGAQNAYNEVPQNRFLPEFYDKYQASLNLSSKREIEGPYQASSQAPTKPRAVNRSSEQEQEQEQEQQVKPLASAKPPRPKNEPDTELQALCKAVWHAYALAYQDRYGTAPIRNAKINSNVKGFCLRIPAADAPHVAAWYVGHNGQRYVAGGHVFGLLLADAEKLRTEWATNRKITNSQSRLADQTEGRGQVWGALIAEAEERERNGSEQAAA